MDGWSVDYDQAIFRCYFNAKAACMIFYFCPFAVPESLWKRHWQVPVLHGYVAGMSEKLRSCFGCLKELIFRTMILFSHSALVGYLSERCQDYCVFCHGFHFYIYFYDFKKRCLMIKHFIVWTLLFGYLVLSSFLKGNYNGFME